jgi:predicted dehydrogenase
MASWAGHGGATVVADGSVFYGSQARVTGTRATFDSAPSADLGEQYASRASADRQARDFPLGLTDSFALAQLDWLEAVRQRRPPETSGREGLHDLAAAFAIVESATLGRRVELAEVLDGRASEYQRSINQRHGFA